MSKEESVSKKIKELANVVADNAVSPPVLLQQIMDEVYPGLRINILELSSGAGYFNIPFKTEGATNAAVDVLRNLSSLRNTVHDMNEIIRGNRELVNLQRHLFGSAKGNDEYLLCGRYSKTENICGDGLYRTQLFKHQILHTFFTPHNYVIENPLEDDAEVHQMHGNPEDESDGKNQ